MRIKINGDGDVLLVSQASTSKNFEFNVFVGSTFGGRRPQARLLRTDQEVVNIEQVEFGWDGV